MIWIWIFVAIAAGVIISIGFALLEAANWMTDSGGDTDS